MNKEFQYKMGSKACQISLYDIPIELIVNFVIDSVEVYVALLVFRPFAQWTINKTFLCGNFADYLKEKGIKVDAVDDRTNRVTYLKTGGKLKLHSFFEIPSQTINLYGMEYCVWHKNGILHRDILNSQGNPEPTVIGPSFSVWYKDGKLHSYPNTHGELMPARVTEYRKEWYKNELIHREKKIGPAIIYRDTPYYFENGEYCGPEFIRVRDRIFEVKSGLISNKTEFTYEDLFISFGEERKYWSKSNKVSIYGVTK